VCNTHGITQSAFTRILYIAARFEQNYVVHVFMITQMRKNKNYRRADGVKNRCGQSFEPPHPAMIAVKMKQRQSANPRSAKTTLLEDGVAATLGVPRNTLANQLPEMRNQQCLKTTGEGYIVRQYITLEGQAFLQQTPPAGN
jgi:hypothetical protein